MKEVLLIIISILILGIPECFAIPLAQINNCGKKTETCFETATTTFSKSSLSLNDAQQKLVNDHGTCADEYLGCLRTLPNW